MAKNYESTHETYHPELRRPLREALEIVANIADCFDWHTELTPNFLGEVLEKVKKKYNTCIDFEREFISVALSIATGVGKTRLMGSIMTHLYLTGKSRNFFVLAPNLTIYEKLIQDFGNPNYAKYAFKGIAAFVNHPPMVVTGDNYAQTSSLFAEREVRINIFNISKFNKDSTEGGKKTGVPRIKRLSEYLGVSYWEYLTKLNDLVILMDEAHRYHADKSKKVLNDLKPKFGVELTATPFIPKNGNAVADKENDKANLFKNVVYEYSLAAALAEGKYIKIPAIATRENFTKESKSEDEIERIKLEDAVSVHETTKKELQRYALTMGKREVKPFILVVCRDTKHAKEVHDYINSRHFYNGQYAQKVLQIDSTTRTSEDIEKQFVSLEKADNPIEIVIHVNMLKEGWDVSNLYTIVPLRAAKALTLIEQTIGRGLRLPYGERTGDTHVDTLTVVSHEHFDQVITASKEESSIFQTMKFVTIDKEGVKLAQIPDRITQAQAARQAQIETLKDATAKQNAQHVLDAERALINVLPKVSEFFPQVKSVSDCNKPEIKKVVIDLVKTDLANRPQTLFSSTDNAAIAAQVATVYEQVVKDFEENFIEIPRLVVTPLPPKVIFEDFELNTSGQGGIATKFEFHENDHQIIRTDLVQHKTDYIHLKKGAKSRYPETEEQKIINKLLDYNDIEYDACPNLIHKLARQATQAIRQTMRPKESLDNIIVENVTLIAGRIYEQMKAHFRLEATTYGHTTVHPLTKIYSHNITTAIKDGRLDYRSEDFKKSDIGKLVFMGFKKAAHAEYKFDSKSELDFATLLERDNKVMKWLRPAPMQFEIYWSHQSKKYEPDFVVETAEKNYLVEVKAANELANSDVLEKAKSAQVYCQTVNQWCAKNGKKKWEYVLIAHDRIKTNSTFGYLVQ